MKLKKRTLLLIMMLPVLFILIGRGSLYFFLVHRYSSIKKSSRTVLRSYLEKTLTHFNVHSFTVKDASFTVEKLNAPALHGGHINLFLANFTE
jgi:hypothetical protein